MSTPQHTQSAPVEQAGATAVPYSAQWLVGALLISAVLYYFIGVDEGATSIVRGDVHVHELIHDARHFLGFPCH
jgi:hypothetical protein